MRAREEKEKEQILAMRAREENEKEQRVRLHVRKKQISCQPSLHTKE
jgi:hypothetical protein